MFSSMYTTGAIWDSRNVFDASGVYKGTSNFANLMFKGIWVTLNLPYMMPVQRLTFVGQHAFPAMNPRSYRLYGKDEVTATSWTLIKEDLDVRFTPVNNNRFSSAEWRA
jgi:hypothetical protein